MQLEGGMGVGGGVGAMMNEMQDTDDPENILRAWQIKQKRIR